VKHEVVTGGLLPLWGDIDIAYNLFQGSDKKAAQVRHLESTMLIEPGRTKL
jgi:hypothetical protein